MRTILKPPLAIYLHDHLAGANYALDLVHALSKNYAGTDFGNFASLLYQEIAADKETLHDLARNFGSASDPVKDTAAWLSEKVSRIKLSHSDSNALGTFEALEFLRLGIYGKSVLWQVLAYIAPSHAALAHVDFARLLERARVQEQEVERYRLEFARRAFTSTDGFSEGRE